MLSIFFYDVKELKKILEKQNGCWYGKKKIGCSTEFIQKYVNRITNISRAIAVKLCNNYKIASKIDDYASDTFLYIIEKCGDLEKNHEDDEDALFRKITLRAKLAMKGKIILDNFVIRETRTCYNTDKYGNLEVKDDKSDVENEALNRVYDEDKDIAQIKMEILKKIDMGEDVNDVLEDLSDKLGCDKNELIMKIREYYIENINEGISH